MNIDQRDIEKGALVEILPKFYANSISYLGELNAYRMYAEIWGNKRSTEGQKRSEIGHVGYLKTLEFGESKKRRRIDRVKFEHFVVADSINYKVEKSIYGELMLRLQIGGKKNNSIFNKIIKAKPSFKTESLSSDSDFHPESDLLETLELDLHKLGLSQDERTNKYYFEISTNIDSISNQNQKMILLRILGRDDIFEKLHLLYKVGRTHIRCLFENPESVIKNIGMPNAIPRLCVAWPFHETLVFDFAGIAEDYGDVCLLGTLITTEEKIVKAPGVPTDDAGWLDGPQIDSYA
ncbi:MAG: hypothetical protein K8F52_18805 [Candidatus Scalindua rubra]|uniref:Uncharacterized protein n=1 Tax=Candidatus Scalindua brodae TaxID=237368 RepID=A0A0B0EI11_9BACT|nr:MAG: hypothetical protein SCABRO_02050 [Candidatus Scalindua brodae]MBZ0110709.1 hypothetical protein [Candidatus Scalindua rubra]TWU31883.1 hypothetical protein S225a_19650 [Candidatus Brocadiaceae bacterium S225]